MKAWNYSTQEDGELYVMSMIGYGMNIREQVALLCARIAAEQRQALIELGYTHEQIDEIFRTGKAPDAPTDRT